MRAGDAIAAPQPPIDHRRKGESSWLRVARETNGAAPPAPPAH
jgi:hypothetical protein